MAMCNHGWQFETCKFGCTLRKKEELKLANDELQEENEKLKKMKGAAGVLQQIADRLKEATGKENVWAAIKHFEAEIEKLKEENRWIPVSERLPELPVSIHNESSGLLWLIAKDKPCQGYYNNFEGWRICGKYQKTSEYQREVTHWKPIILPEQVLEEVKNGKET